MSSLLIERSGAFIFEPFLKHGALAAFSTRTWNFISDSSGKRDERSAWSEFCTTIQAPLDRIAHFKQVHGDRIVFVREDFKTPGFPRLEKMREEADAGITKELERPIAILTADCASVFFLDSRNRAAGVAHVGWRGAEKKLSSKIVKEMWAQFETLPKDLLVALGPLIRSCCYEVGPEFQGRFPGCVETRGSKYFFDLKKAIEMDLLKAGIEQKNILDSGFCTACNTDKFFSYRKEGAQTGRICSISMVGSIN